MLRFVFYSGQLRLHNLKTEVEKDCLSYFLNPSRFSVPSPNHAHAPLWLLDKDNVIICTCGVEGCENGGCTDPFWLPVLDRPRSSWRPSATADTPLSARAVTRHGWEMARVEGTWMLPSSSSRGRSSETKIIVKHLF